MRYPRQAQAAPLPSAEYCAASNKNEILAITGSMTAIAIVVVVIRLLVRAFMTRSLGPDDHAISLALLLTIATMVCFVYETNYAIGKHSLCITPKEYEMFGKWQYFHSMWSMIGVVIVKISIALFLARLVPPGKKWQRLLWGIIVFLVCFCLSCLGTLIFQCIPISAAWDSSLRAEKSTTCFSNSTFTDIGLINSTINCVTDFILAVLPLPLVTKLQVNMRTKLSLGVILSLGYFACAAGIVKTVKQHSFFQEKDPTWHNSFNVWHMTELCVGILASSLPALRPLFDKILKGSKHALSGSWPGSKYSKNPTINVSSGPRCRAGDDVESLMGREFQFEMLGCSSRTPQMDVSEVSTVFRETARDRKRSLKEAPYTVAISGGELSTRRPSDAGGSCEGLEPARRGSVGPINRLDAVYKTTEITSLTYSRSN
ncbi:hypothetical protein AC579_1709 [Lecanosticta acicola]|uniref:Rhodopsin domain-containing protein n=1 Tax=Lecanosticta acicola TaxID=111012 RepID=A0AAI8W0V8_9PEZI|nr:hypothetical protein AC579_1709 [Lecanosticta acicola]